MLESVVASLAAAALLRMGRQVETAAKAARGKTDVEELRASALLGNFEFETSSLRLAVHLPRDVTAADVAAILQSPEAEAISFELLTLVLTDSMASGRERVARRWCDLVTRAHPAAAEMANQLLDAMASHYEIAVGVVKDECPNAYARLREDSHHRRIACVLEAIHHDLGGAGEVIGADDAQKFSELYRRQLRQAHKYITPPDFDSRRDVAIDDLYVSPTIRHSAIDAEQSISVDDLLGEIDRTVLLGDPGNGKSTASQVLLYRTAAISTAPVPFLVVLRDFAPGLERSVVEYLENRLSTVYQCTPPTGYVEYVLETGQALVIFDGLDELLDTSHRRAVTDAVGLFCNRYPLIRTLVTSRRVGYRQAPMDERQFSVLELSGFDVDQVHAYVRKWFSQETLTAEQVEAWTNAFMRESEGVRDLTGTPLLLALMCIIYRGERSLPRNRPAVYERCAKMLFDKWDSSRGINSDLRVGQLVDPAMKYLAYWLFSEDTGDGVTEQALVRKTTSYLHERSFETELEAEAAAREFVQFCRGRAWVFSDVGTTPEGEALYKFTHRTFLEYFAAYHLSRTTDTPEKLARLIAGKVANAEWDVVAQLAVQITDKHIDMGAIRVFEVLLKDRRRRSPHKRVNMLSFLGRCLSFVQVSPSVLRNLTREALAWAVGARGDSGRYATEALSTLLAHSHFVDENVVASELLSELERYLERDSEEVAEAALSLLSVPQIIAPTFSNGGVGSDGRINWQSWLGDLAERNRGKYLAGLGSSAERSRVCINRGWIGLTEYLDAFNEGLGPMLRDSPIRCLNAAFLPYASTMLSDVVDGIPRSRPSTGSIDYAEQFAELAVFAEKQLERDLPLWSGGISPYIAHDLGTRRRPGAVQLDERQLLGAGILMACIAEASPQGLAATRGWGVLRPMAEWLKRRGDEASSAPVPWADEKDFSLLYRWVRGEISFGSVATEAAR